MPEATERTSPNQVSKVFSPQLVELLSTAEQLKKDQGGDVIEVKDVLCALCQSDSEGAQILRDAGVDVEALLARLQQ